MTTDFRALCKELTDELHGYASANPYHDSDELVARARAALAAEPEPPDTGEVPKLREAPAAWLYRGDPDFDGTTWLVNWRVTTDERVARFNALPDKPVPLFRHPVALAAAPVPPVEGEVAELVNHLLKVAAEDESDGCTYDSAFTRRAADLLERLASPACVVVKPSPELIEAFKAAGPRWGHAPNA